MTEEFGFDVRGALIPGTPTSHESLAQANQGGTSDFYKCSDNSNCVDRVYQALEDSRKWELERRASLG